MSFFYFNLKHFLFFIFALLFNICRAFSQTPITVNDHWLFVNVTIQHQGQSKTVSAPLDTGASVCLMDSTYAADSCHIHVESNHTSLSNLVKKRVQAYKIMMDSIVLGDSVYHDVCCYISDLKSRFRQFTPNFIIGGDVLKRSLWCVDLKQNALKRLDAVPAHIQATIQWKNHDDYADAALNHIYFTGKIAGKKQRILFDTGSKSNQLPQKCNIASNDSIDTFGANVVDSLTKIKVKVARNTPVEFNQQLFHVDFQMGRSKTLKYPLINSDFLSSQVFVLDYKKKQLYIL